MTYEGKAKTILVTGACGMIGSATVKGLLSAGYHVIGIDRKDYNEKFTHYKHYVVDLADKSALKQIVEENRVDRLVHMAALAHSNKGDKYSWDDYYHFNVDCSKNIFDVAGEIPVLFISTVDVYGFAKGIVDNQTELHPVSHYAISKVQAESECRKLSDYTIFRLSPVYTETVKRDIQKRYYLKYPQIAYRIGAGMEYEILSIHGAVNAIVKWCEESVKNDVRIIKDQKRMVTTEYIKAEKQQGRANIVLYFPRWMVKIGYNVLKIITGENKFTYLLYKAIFPLRSE